ncbi:MAG: HD domain-containing protein [Chloroflexi bacterium]|nr:HD domain-containing protein [Chloroflexota bacterium]
MGKQSSSRFYFTFAAWTFLAVGIVAAVVTILQLQSVGSQAEADATAAVNRTVLPALGLDAADISAGDFEDFMANADVLLGQQDVQAIRLLSADGELLAEVGAGQDAPTDLQAVMRAAEQGAAMRHTDSQQGDVLQSYVRFSPEIVIEIQQDYEPIASSVSTGRWRLALIAFAGTAVALVLLQTILWAATHGMRNGYDRLLYLYRSGQAMRSTLDLTRILEQLARDAATYTNSRLGLATLLEEETGDLIFRAGYDAKDGETIQYARQVDLWYMRRCAVTGEMVFAPEEDFPYDRILGHEDTDIRPVSVLNIAIPGHNGPIGVVTLVRPSAEGGFKTVTIEVVEELAAQAGMSIEQVALFTKARDYAENLEQSYDGTLRVLMAALDTKDSVTQGHSERVARLTVSLAKEMNVASDRVVDMERGALLHDVGKIGVPDTILQKPSALDDDEWEAMEKHPLYAGLMISKVAFLEGALPIILYHHERYDGAGYPFRLEGKAIPFDARIFAVVDSYDAMTFDRPYRKAMPIAEALAEIERNSGSQFDPEVVVAFTRLIRRTEGLEAQAA